jgi:hypothetical protein
MPTRKPRLGPRKYSGECIYPRCDHAGYGRPDKCICRKWEQQDDHDRATRPPDYLAAIRDIPQQPQRQDSLDDQLQTLQAAANKLGCYDAADWLNDMMHRRPIFLPPPVGHSVNP